jgi:HSP20 family protein
MLMKLNPFANSGIARSATPVSSAFDELFRDTAFTTPSAWINGPALPAADFEEGPDSFVLTMDLPGYDPKSLDLQVDGDVLTIHAERTPAAEKGTWLSRERFFGKIARSFVLPRTVDASKCEARAEHGVLTVTLPKREEAKRRSIAVTVKS